MSTSDFIENNKNTVLSLLKRSSSHEPLIWFEGVFYTAKTVKDVVESLKMTEPHSDIFGQNCKSETVEEENFCEYLTSIGLAENIERSYYCKIEGKDSALEELLNKVFDAYMKGKK